MYWVLPSSFLPPKLTDLTWLTAHFYLYCVSSVPWTHSKSPNQWIQPDMAARFLSLPAALQRALKTAFHNWLLVPAAFNPGGHRALTNTHPWIPIPPANDVLATGGEGIVHVWCQVNPATQLITDRVVVKQVIVSISKPCTALRSYQYHVAVNRGRLYQDSLLPPATGAVLDQKFANRFILAWARTI